MVASTERWPGRTALIVAHCAGMVDLVALPVWINDLIGNYHFDPQQAGMMVTLFLVGALICSLIVAPRFNRINTRRLAVVGFGVSALAFLGASLIRDFAPLAALHLIGGLATGCGLSVTHGTIGRSGNPHRLFAFANAAIGVFAVVFLGVTSKLIETPDGSILFKVFAGVMLVATIVVGLAFPAVTAAETAAANYTTGRIAPGVWFGIVGVSCMALNQAMMFSFVERIGIDRGFAPATVTNVLIVLGFVNLVPGPLAALLQHRIPAGVVILVGPILQAVLALLITMSSGFLPYALPTVVYVTIMIFTHVFAFGLLARLDTTGRALAGTPAMLMVGSSVGPILGGTLVKFFGYPALGVAACVVAVVAVTLFSRVRAPLAAPAAAAA